MGATNASLVRVTARQYRLTNVEALVLGMIALVSLDEDGRDRNGNVIPARTYFGGWEALAESLPELDDPTSTNARKYVQKVLARLIGKGALERVAAGRRGHRAEYRLTVSLTPGNVVPIDSRRGPDSVDNSPVRTVDKGETGTDR